MNSILTTYFKSTVVNAGKLMRYQVATFATAKAKVEATPAKSKKASKEDTKQNEKQVKSLLLQYYKMKTYSPSKLSPEKQKEYSAIAKEYSRQMTYLQHQAELRLNDKIFLRDLAIAALPTEELRKQAKMTDTEQIPGKYFYPAKKAQFEDLSKDLAW